ncbi:hypothetical protein NUSPORA_02469 [Nucleospora cyclopteri]
MANNIYISHFFRCCLRSASLSDMNSSYICDMEALSEFYNKHSSYKPYSAKFKPMVKIEGEVAKEFFGLSLLSNCYFLTIEELSLLSKYLNIKMHFIMRLEDDSFNIMKFEKGDVDTITTVLYLDSVANHYMALISNE